MSFSLYIIFTCKSLLSVVCDETTDTGQALYVEIQLNYPSDMTCQTPTCIADLYNKIYNDFETKKNLNLTSDDGQVVQMELCEISDDPYGN